MYRGIRRCLDDLQGKSRDDSLKGYRQMFVEIDNQDMDAFKVEKLINETRDANGGVISPEFAMEVLGKTNHFAHIKKVINLIKKNCSDKNGELVADKVAPYKEFILSCVDRREVSPQAMAVLQELAETGGFKDEFDKTNDKVKIYEVKDCENTDVKIIKSKKEFEALGGENLRIFFDADYINLVGCYLGEVKSLKFKKGAEVCLYKAKHFTKDLDVSMCSVVDLRGCDLEGLKLKFREGAEINLMAAVNLPKNFDLSMCSKVNLRYCDLKGVEKIKFKDKEQEEEFMKEVKNFSGEVEYEGDDEKGKIMPMNNGGMEM